MYTGEYLLFQRQSKNFNLVLIFSDLGPLRCYVIGFISAILYGDNTSIDTSDKSIG